MIERAEAPRMTTLTRPFDILAKHYSTGSTAYEILTVHSVLVTQLALEIAERYTERNPDTTVDLQFITEAALLHDIGIVGCNAKAIGCEGEEPYICHGVLGREILEAEGLPRHALVCERHTGSGIRANEVREAALPLPERDFLPVSVEEKIICVADKFYGKNPRKLWRRQELGAIDRKIAAWGNGPKTRWEKLKREFL